MANIKISELTALTPPDAADLVPVTDASASQTKRTTVGEIVGIVNGDVDVADDGTATISELPVSKLQDGAARQLLQTDAAGTGVEWTSNVDVPGTLDVTGAAALDSTLDVAGLASLDGGIDVDGAFTVANTSGNIATSGTLGVTGQSTLASAAVSDLTSGRVVLAGTSGELEDNAKLTFNGTQLDVDGNVVITGDLTVEGASTILETETVKVEDKNIELGVVTSPTDVTADGGGITLKGTTDKTINWVDATDAWTSSERFSVPLGSEAAPSLTFTGDPNTGIYSPGADQVAISTNGTGRLFINSTGDVCFGSQVGANGDGSGISIYNASFPRLSFRNSTTGNSFTDGSQLYLVNSDLYVTNNENANLIFRTNTVERLRITSAGLVGIGTSSPSTSLDVVGTIKSSTTISAASDFRINNNSFSRVAHSNGSGAFVGGYNVKWSSGVKHDSTGSLSAIYYDNNGVLRFYTNGSQAADTAAQERLTITAAGAVGIGTTSPQSELVVRGSTPQITLEPTADTQSCRLQFALTDGTFQSGVYGGGVYGQNLVFVRATGETARIDSSGRLLVGTSTSRSNWYNGSGRDPQIQLEQSGNTRLGITRTDANNNGPELLFGKTRGSAYQVVASSDEIGEISFQGADGTELVEAASIKAEVDGTPGANDMPGRLVFSVTADGASSPTEALRISNDRSITVSDGGNIVVGTTTGTKIGTATSQKIGFFDATPVVQPTTGVTEAAFVENSGGTAVNVDSTFGGYTLQQVVQALQNLGILA